ncbi:MAG: glycosyltransferase family 2 protein, partial [Anaerolineae bacterium]
MTSLSVIIPTYQRRDRLRRVLDALARQDAPPFEVIVSLDGCTDGTQDMLTTLSVPYPLRWINGPNGGPGAARHRGARLAHSDRLLFLDDDILAQPGLLAAHLDPHPNAVCFGQVRTLPGLPLS